MADATASGPACTLAHKCVFGLNASVNSNVHFAEESQIVYPAGTNTILWLAEKKEQKFFQGSDNTEGITCLAVNVTKRYLAVAEKSFEGAFVTIFDLVNAKKKRTLPCQEVDVAEYVWIAFSSDSKYLLTQTGASASKSGKHDWTLTYWMWDKQRAMASARVSNAAGAPIREVSFNPTDSTVVCVIGDGIFKFLQQKDGFKTLPVNAGKMQSFLCHTWLSDDKLLVACENGDLMLFDNAGEFITVLTCSPGDPRSVTVVLGFSKGFVSGGDDGLIRVFEKSDDPKEHYRKSKSIQLDGYCVKSLALSPSEDMLAVTTSNAQLFQLSLLGQDLVKADEAPVFEPVLTPFHTNAILGMDVCTRKPLVVTCGADHSVRIWNYLEKSSGVAKFYNEEAYSVAFHPSGFHLIVGFADKLRLMNLLMEDIRQYKEVTIKQCRECRFSNGGQYFAAVSGQQIMVYKTYTCELVAKLSGHNNKVRSIAWTADDSTIVSTGADGAVYEYDILREGRRVGYDFVQKGISFSCVIVHTDPDVGANTMYVVGSDKLMEIHGGRRQDAVEAGTTLGQIVLSNTSKTMFAAAAENGAPAPIRCYKFPLDGYYAEFPCHAGPCLRMRITYDDNYLFTCSEDGCLFVFDVKKKDRMVAKRDKENVLPFADEILVTRAFLDEKQTTVGELERQVDELSNQIEFQLRHRESFHKEEEVELDAKYTAEIEQERTKYDLLREEKTDMEMEYDENIKNLQELHSKQIQDLEGTFQHKMMKEVGRYQQLAKEREEMHRYWEAEYKNMMDKHRKALQEMQQDFAEKMERDRKTIKNINNEKDMAERIHNETKNQLEQDTDKEIEELKEEKLARLETEKNDKVRLRGQSGISKRHHEDLNRQMHKREEDLRLYQDEAKKKQEKIDQLQRESDHNKSQIKDRDRMIGDKEQKIYDLKKQNQELEKYKFVLDHKIKDLKAQIDPKNDDIAEMKQQIQKMDGELEDYHKQNKQLEVNIEGLGKKQQSLQEEIVTQRKRMLNCQTVIKRFKNDLHECVEFIQEPKKLRDSVNSLYKKYVPNGIKKQELDADIQREYSRQKDYLEKSVESLKRKLLKDSDVHRLDNNCILHENVGLIREINELRKEIDFLKRERQQQRLHVSKKAAPNKSASSSFPQVDVQASQVLEDNARTIASLKARIEEHERLRRAQPSHG